MIIRNFCDINDFREWNCANFQRTTHRHHIGLFKFLTKNDVLVLFLERDNLWLSYDDCRIPIKSIIGYKTKGKSSSIDIKGSGFYNKWTISDKSADESIEGDFTAYEREHSDFLLFLYNLTKNEANRVNLIRVFKENEQKFKLP